MLSLDKKTKKTMNLARGVYFLVTAVLIITVLTMGYVITRNVAEETAYRTARQHAVETAANLQVHMNPHMRLMRQISYSSTIARWLSGDPENPEAKAAAFDEIMGHALTWPEARYMFTFADTLRSYNFFTHLESAEDFTYWGYLPPGGTGHWYYNTLAAEPPFIINIQRDQPDEYGNFDILVWSNHRIYYDGRLVGVFTLGSSFDAIQNAVFGGFCDDNKRGYVLNRYGNVRLDSAGLLDLFAEGVPIAPPAPEVEKNPALAETIASHLRAMDGGLFPLGTFMPETVRLEAGEFHFAAIAPVVDTDWSVMVLSARATGINPQYYPMIVASVILLIVSVLAVNRLVRRFVLIPLQEMERQKKENEAHELVQRIIDTAPVVINMWDDNLNLLSTNRRALELYELKSQEEYVNNFLKLSPEIQPDGSASIEKIPAIMKRASETGYVEFEWMHQTLDGKPRPALITIVCTTYRDKKVIFGYTTDLRHVKEAEERLRKAVEKEHELEMRLREQELDERVRVMLDTTPLSINYWNKDLKIINCNKYAVEFYGFASKEDYLRDGAQLSLPETQPDGSSSTDVRREILLKIFREGYGRFEFGEKKLNGEKFILEGEGVRLKDSASGEDVVVTYAKDITKEREAAQQKADADAYKYALLEASPMFIDVWDEDFNLIDCNDKVCELLGVPSKDEFLNNLAEKYNPRLQPCGTPSVELYTEKLKIGIEQGYVKYHWTHLDVNGNEVPLEVTYVRIMHKGKRVLVGYNYDLRELKKAEAERKRIEVAEESNRAKSNFLARVSHEIRTPITAVLGISEIQMQNSALPPKVEESFAKIHDSAQVLTKIVNDILDLSKIETGKMELVEDEYETAYLISDAANMHLAHLGEKDIAFKMFIDENLPTHLYGDSLRIGQILNNLLSNAFKYTERGEVELELQYGEDETLILSVRDTGYGMSKEQLDTIYSDYSRFHEYENRFIVGTGLGMPIVYSLAQLMRAEIEIESELGVGTRVVVIIPQKKAGPEVLGAEIISRLQNFERIKYDAKKFKFSVEPMPYGKVLVVDDLEANLYVARGLLAFYGIEVDTCMSGGEAVEKIKRGGTYDLILLDYMMPGLNGTETLNALRKEGCTVPIVALTANALIGRAEEFMRVGFDGFISKPINTAHLNMILLKFVKRQGAAAEQPPEDVVEIEGYQPEFMQKLCTLFARRHKNAPQEIRAAIKADDIASAHIQVHSLKSAAGLIHENMLAQMAEAVENALSSGRVPSESALEMLEGEFERVYTTLAGAQKKDADTEDALALLDKMTPLLEQQNVQCVEMAEQLRHIPEAAIFISQIESFDFASALKSAEVLKAILA